jgi:adenylylsulfate kinase-like enzyme
MRLVFLWGLPGSGKLTVAKELSALTCWKLFHNHLTVDLLLAVFPFGCKEFIELREQIWLSVFETAVASKMPGLIFTFNPENTVRQSFIEQTLSLISKHSARVEFVEIFCEESALENRLDTPERRIYKKMLSVADYRKLRNRGVFTVPVMPAPQMRVDTTQQSPREAAAQIVEGLGLPLSSERAE